MELQYSTCVQTITVIYLNLTIQSNESMIPHVYVNQSTQGDSVGFTAKIQDLIVVSEYENLTFFLPKIFDNFGNPVLPVYNLSKAVNFTKIIG